MAYDVYQYSAADRAAANSNVVRPDVDCWDDTRQALLRHGDRQHPNRYHAENGTTYVINGNATIYNGQYLPPNGQDFRRPGDLDTRAADLNYQELQRLQAQNYYRPGYQPGYQSGYQPADWRTQQIERMRYQEQLREQALLNGGDYGYQPRPSFGFHIGFGGRHSGFGISIGNQGYERPYYRPTYYQPSYQQAYYQPSYQQAYYQPSYQPSYYQPSYQQAYYQQPGAYIGARFGGHHHGRQNGFSFGFTV